MKRTIKDVAREANVSIATVSRVINSKDKVKEETRVKIIAAIENLNYIPDYTARSMIQKKTKMIGFMPPDLASGYWSELSEVLQDVLWKKGYALLVASHNKNEEKINSILDIFQERNVDGIILGPITNEKNFKNEYLEKAINNMKNRGVAIVTLQGPELKDVASVNVDHQGGAKSVVEYLASKGHKRIAYIGGEYVSSERELGYRCGLKKYDLPIIEDLIILTKNNQSFIEYGYNAAAKLIACQKTFTAVFCGNDLIAIGAMKMFKEKGITIPDQVSIVGFDDISASSMVMPSLTTVRQPITEIGYSVVDSLVEQIENQNEKRTKEVVLPTKLVIRETTK